MSRGSARVYRTPDGSWHFRCAFCTQMNGFELWRAAYDLARWHLATCHEVTSPVRGSSDHLLDALEVAA